MMGLASGTAGLVQELPVMTFDLILAAAFLVMIIAPALVTLPSERDERDSL